MFHYRPETKVAKLFTLSETLRFQQHNQITELESSCVSSLQATCYSSSLSSDWFHCKLRKLRPSLTSETHCSKLAAHPSIVRGDLNALLIFQSTDGVCRHRQATAIGHAVGECHLPTLDRKCHKLITSFRRSVEEVPVRR